MSPASMTRDFFILHHSTLTNTPISLCPKHKQIQKIDKKEVG